jgi:AcrR family transcriptional regulator
MEIRAYNMEARAEAMEATRQRILDAVRELFAEHWWEDVTLNGIAAAAGVSHQTVLNHFGSKDGVLSAVVEQGHARVGALREQVEPGDSAAAVAALIAQYEESGLANVRAVYQEHRVPALKAALDEARRVHRAWVERTFAHALPPAGAARRQKVAAFLAATELMTWKALRHDYGFSRRDAAAAMAGIIDALEAEK